MVSKNNCCNLVDEKLTCTADAGVKTKKSYETPCVNFVVLNETVDVLNESGWINYEDWFGKN